MASVPLLVMVCAPFVFVSVTPAGMSSVTFAPAGTATLSALLCKSFTVPAASLFATASMAACTVV